MVNSNDFSCVLLIGQASSAYNKHGIHLELINCRTTSSEEDLPILPKTAKNYFDLLFTFLSDIANEGTLLLSADQPPLLQCCA